MQIMGILRERRCGWGPMLFRGRLYLAWSWTCAGPGEGGAPHCPLFSHPLGSGRAGPVQRETEVTLCPMCPLHPTAP